MQLRKVEGKVANPRVEPSVDSALWANWARRRLDLSILDHDFCSLWRGSLTVLFCSAGQKMREKTRLGVVAPSFCCQFDGVPIDLKSH